MDLKPSFNVLLAYTTPFPWLFGLGISKSVLETKFRPYLLISRVTLKMHSRAALQPLL